MRTTKVVESREVAFLRSTTSGKVNEPGSVPRSDIMNTLKLESRTSKAKLAASRQSYEIRKADVERNTDNNNNNLNVDDSAPGSGSCGRSLRQASVLYNLQANERLPVESRVEVSAGG